MTAHAIGDQDEPEVAVDLERVFVLRADTSVPPANSTERGELPAIQDYIRIGTGWNAGP
jgi:hypothetical protein